MENNGRKKTLYILASMFLWLLLSFIAHALIEMWLIGRTLEQGLIPQSTTGPCYLPVIIQILFIASGLVFGYIVGERWWQIVYVEHRHWRYRKKVK